MAETVVCFLLDQLSTLLREEEKLLGGLRNDIQEIKDELEHMRAFLRVAEAKEEEDPRFQEWIRQVREAAYDTEDILDEFMLRFAFNRPEGYIGRIFSSLKNLLARHRIASEVQQIKKRTAGIFERQQRYLSEYGTIDQVSEYVEPNKRRRLNTNRDDALLVEEAKLVGIDGPRKLLISQLIDRDSQLKVVSVLGMGGLGKTTLVRRVYEDTDMRREFQVRAWITVSQTVCQIEDLLKDLIEQLCKEIKEPKPQEIKSMRSDRLKMYLKNLLQGKRYVIVFDDVWHTDFWNNIKFALPEGAYGNRVVLTTRISEVASAPHVEFHGYLHKMEPLSFEESWTLFCQKTFEDHSCPAHLNNICESILGKCEGLPLAIVAISGVFALKDKNNLKEWEMVRFSLGAELEGSGKLDCIKKILSLSYNDLPYYLKTCLLYLSIFPEDHLITCWMLIRLWIAERFVEQKGGMTVEEVANGYLRELISRSLIQVTKEYANELIHCCIHDLLREILLSKSRELNIMAIATAQNTRWPEKVRRLVIHSCLDNSLQLQEGNRFKHLRSLITFGSMRSLSKPFIDKILLGGSRFLKILHLMYSQVDEIPDEVFNLLHLRYLSLKGTRIKIVPKAIGKLENLEYLDVSETQVSELPKEILKLQKLRQLIVFRVGDYSKDYNMHGFKALPKIGMLHSLQFLKCIDVDSGNIVSEIGKLTQLSKLSIAKLRSEDGEELCSSLQKLTNLYELEVTSVHRDEIIDLDYCASSSLHSLQKLHLQCRLENLPRWIPSLQGLTVIKLSWSELKDDPLESLQHLPNLLGLYLSQAYQGKGLRFKAGGFLKLKILTLRKCGGMKWARVEEGAMPHLQELWLIELKLLEELPCGIQHLSNLRSVILTDMNDNLIGKLLDGNEGKERRKIAHVPHVEIAHFISRDKKWQVRYL